VKLPAHRAGYSAPVNLLRGTVKVIDLHSHILFGIDDGPKVIEESIQMCRIGYQDGIRTIVATPHIQPGIYQNNRSTILTKLHELNTALVYSELRTVFKASPRCRCPFLIRCSSAL